MVVGGMFVPSLEGFAAVNVKNASMKYLTLLEKIETILISH